MLDRTFQRDPSSTDTSIEILYKLATVVCLIWEASFLVTIRRYCDPRLTWRLRAATPGPRTRLTAPWKGSVKPTDLFTWALLKHHQGVHRTHCHYLQGAVYRPQAVLQSPEVCPQNHPLQLSLGAKGQGYTFLSALVCPAYSRKLSACHLCLMLIFLPIITKMTASYSAPRPNFNQLIVNYLWLWSVYVITLKSALSTKPCVWENKF